MVFCLLFSSRAIAQPFDASDKESVRPVADGFSLAIGRPGALYLVKGKQFTKLGPADRFISLAVDKTAKKVVAEIGDYTCAGQTHYEWTIDHFTARMENASAYALHLKKDFKAAAAGFARAAAADPAWRIPAYNLASALQLAGDKPGAVKALATWLASEPIATYLHVATDPELAPLLDQPTLAAIRTTKVGAAKLTTAGIDGVALFAPERGLLAIARNEASWGSAAFTTELQIWDIAQGKLVASTTIVAWDETDPSLDKPAVTKAAKQKVADRIARLETQLAALGFRKAKIEKGVENGDGTKAKVSFAKAKIGVVGPGDMAEAAFKDGIAHVLRKNTTLANAKIVGRLRAATFVEDASAVIIETQRHSAEGCDGGPELGLVVVKI